MTQTLVGTPKRQLDTPALCLDLDAMEANIRSMAGFLRERGKQWRPHVKCHKTPAIAWAQIREGAMGVTCAKVSEAEVFAAAGIRDILIANMLVGEKKLRRVAALTRTADPIVACDHYTQAEMLSAACRTAGTTCRAIIEVDIGLQRVGTRPGADTLELAQGMERLPGIDLVGIMGYEGHLLTEPDLDVKRARIADSIAILEQTRDQFLHAGLCCDIVSAGGTGSYQITADLPAVTELQAGGGTFADQFYLDKCRVQGLTPALTVLATVASRPLLTRAILDTGRKSIHPDIYMPVVKDLPGARVVQLSAEHCKLELDGAAQDLKIGDRIELYVGYSDFTTILHESFLGCRNDVVEVEWPNLARGRLQ